MYEKLFEVATEQYGYVTTDDARDLDVDPHRLVVLASRGDLDRVAHGLYRFGAIPSTMCDQLMEATLWPRRLGTISHDTALGLWDLCDISPAKVHVTVPKAAKLRRTVPAAYRVHVRDLDAGDITHHEGIAVVTVRRGDPRRHRDQRRPAPHPAGHRQRPDPRPVVQVRPRRPDPPTGLSPR